MSFWTWLTGSPAGETANANPASSVGPPGYSPGDPDGVLYDPPPMVVNRNLPALQASPWSGWPAEWSTPDFMQRAKPLIDIAWECLDLNSSILSTMPTYRRKDGAVLDPVTWMQNPDPAAYTSWAEFARQLFWDYQLGEAFVYALARNPQTGWPTSFRVVPPYLMRVEPGPRYYIGNMPVADPADVLHIKYKSTFGELRGMGPLEAAGGRVVTAGLLLQLVQNIAQQGGVPLYWLETDKVLSKPQADSMLDDWVDSRIRNSGRPALLTQGAKASTLSVSTKDMALLELGQWTEARICNKLRVPPHLMGLPQGGESDSMTYSNVTQLFDFHERSGLRPMARSVMSALSSWALPRGQMIEVDLEEYSRPGLLERSQAYVNLVSVNAISAEEIRIMERLHGAAPAPAVTQEGGTGA